MQASGVCCCFAPAMLGQEKENEEDVTFLHGMASPEECQIRIERFQRQLCQDEKAVASLAKFGSASFGKQLQAGFYSDIYTVYARGGTERRKLVVKVVNYCLCNKKSNFANELLVVKLVLEHPHPNLITVLDVVQWESEFWILMEYGGKYDLERFLQNKLRDQGYVAELTALHMYGQLLDALGHLHSLNVVHRDIKPENIMVVARRDTGVTQIHLKLIDFGFSKQVRANTYDQRLYCNSNKGTMEFMAPELLRFSLYYDAVKVDIYGSGVVFYLMLFGKTPFPADLESEDLPLKQLLAIYRDLKQRPIEFPEFPVVSDSTQALICRILSAEPSARPELAVIRQLV